MTVQLPAFSTAILIIQMILKLLLFCSMPKTFEVKMDLKNIFLHKLQ